MTAMPSRSHPIVHRSARRIAKTLDWRRALQLALVLCFIGAQAIAVYHTAEHVFYQEGDRCDLHSSAAQLAGAAPAPLVVIPQSERAAFIHYIEPAHAFYVAGPAAAYSARAPPSVS
ncbi:MAG: hypothetical protein WDO70_02790 [Alphaproteobacteria bacterium]